jgi:hypothetical protein
VVEIRNYLLGKATAEECTRVEERLLVDHEYFEQLLVEEDELIDDYLHGGLTGTEKEHFKRVFLAAPERRERLNFARALERYFDRPSTDDRQHGSWFRLFDWVIVLMRRQVKLVYAGAMVAAAVVVTLIAYQPFNDQRQAATGSRQEDVAAVQAERDELKKQLGAKQDELKRAEEQLARFKASDRSEVSAGGQKPQSSTIAQPAIVFPLSLINVRSIGSQVSTLEIPSGTERISLKLDLENDGFELYRAVLQTEGGQIIRHWDNVKPSFEKRIKNLNLDLPASLLNEETYLLKLQGMENGASPSNAGDVQFKVIRK